jgi:hypothetical protein
MILSIFITSQTAKSVSNAIEVQKQGAAVAKPVAIEGDRRVTLPKDDPKKSVSQTQPTSGSQSSVNDESSNEWK